MRDAHHVGVGGGGVFRIALAEPLNNAEEAGAKLPSVGRDTGDELGETGYLVQGEELEAPLEKWGVPVNLGLGSGGDGWCGGQGSGRGV